MLIKIRGLITSTLVRVLTHHGCSAEQRGRGARSAANQSYRGRRRDGREISLYRHQAGSWISDLARILLS